eukprot:CAMPEP_0179253662 /NCGR_PEP_ID=MMETSP0797-20121207/22846_1 /TAXON_ID=47934 /ORGANISM="Dinophysis acuminata, Strain DAEP01" /LENGTH=83 /DNA_ID=CAMNT_0020961531 /DNA_START=17 /DNA_END=265 /DNA_ORIENTATION=+
MWCRLGRFASPAAQRLLVHPPVGGQQLLAAGAAAALATTALVWKQERRAAAASCEDLITNSDSVKASEFPTLTRYILHRTGDY